MGKMIHANVHENEYQVTIQAVFRKPENLAQSAFYIDETMGGQYGLNSERSSTFSSTFNSDGKNRKTTYAVEQRNDRKLFHLDEAVREKTTSHHNKAKKRPKKRPQSANVTGIDSVRNIV